jgi:hypothetical protein
LAWATPWCCSGAYRADRRCRTLPVLAAIPTGDVDVVVDAQTLEVFRLATDRTVDINRHLRSTRRPALWACSLAVLLGTTSYRQHAPNPFRTARRPHVVIVAAAVVVRLAHVSHNKRVCRSALTHRPKYANWGAGTRNLKGRRGYREGCRDCRGGSRRAMPDW